MAVKYRAIFIIVVVFVCSSFIAKRAEAVGLSNASASATTSRPSAASPLSSPDPLNSGSTQMTVFDNTSTYLSSDSAKIYNGTTYSESINVATTSADKLTVNFTSATTQAHNKTSVLIVPITAMHSIIFTPQTAIPSGGKIIVAYPALGASDSNQASPSASSWTFNGLSTSDIQLQSSLGGSISCSGSSSITGTSANGTPTVTCVTTGGTIPSGATVWLFIGCTASTADSAGGRCTTQRPLLINPTNVGTRGTASVKTIRVSTTDASSNILDQSTLKMGTIESIFVVAHIDPTFSFNIDGVTAGTDLHTAQTCGTSYAAISTTNTSDPVANFSSTGTEVNLGTITSGGNTYSAQKMTIQSNTGTGYAITATASGHLINPGNGAYIVNAQGDVTANNTPAPAVISTGGTGGYGINACDASSRVNTTTWGQASPKFANPAPNYYYTLVNYGGAPASSGDVIYAVYGARAGGSTPPGDYWQVITYTASVTF